MQYRELRRGAGLLALFLASMSVCHAQVQAPSSLTPEQIQIFQSLSPDQQKAIVDATSKSSASGPTDSTVTTGGEGTGEGDVRDISKATPREPGREARALVGPTRIGPQSTLLIVATVAEEGKTETETETGNADDQKTAEQVESRTRVLWDRREQILAGNPYKLDDVGRVALPLLAPITLAGLTATEAGQLLTADPRVAGLNFKVSLLPVAPVGIEALKPFGYELFSGDRSSFAPVTNIPVPTDYSVGPSDTFLVQLNGAKVARYSLVVDRDGELHLPDLEPLVVAGLTFDQVKDNIEQLFAREMIGVHVSVTMGPLRSIRIFVTGDVNNPGSYAVSGISTVTNALFVSGGVSKIGSLRHVQLKRRGVVAGNLDLYALLLNGDSSGDQLLQPGDVVFVPPVGATAGIGGEVRRPAIYELHPGSTVGDLITLSGGLMPEGDPHAAKLDRIDEGTKRVVLDFDVSMTTALTTKLRSGDVLTVPRVLRELSSSVTLEGEVLRPGPYAWHEHMRLTDLLSGLNALKDNADQRYVLIRRERFPDRHVSALSADAVQAFQAPQSSLNPVLQSRDRVIVLPLRSDRGVALSDILQELRAQSRDKASPPVVSISGRTRAPGDYPLEPGMRISDLIRAGGGLDDSAYARDAELIRFDTDSSASRRTRVIPIDLAAALRNDAQANVELLPYDVVAVKEIPEWSTQGAVTLTGEVRFPGRYLISKGETLSAVVRRAGNLTEYAFPAGTTFTREEIREQERRQIDMLAQRMQADLTTLALQNARTPQSSNQGDALAAGESLLAQLRSTKPVGRLVVNLQHALSVPGSNDDVQLRAGDTLAVPRLRQYVTVIGEVENPTSLIWKHRLTRDQYIALSGGTTPRADKKHIYVVRADGSVVVGESGGWFRRSTSMHTGDTIVVPFDAEKMRPLPMWQAITTILYNIAIATAAVHAL